jgi:hypothetical protein
LQKNMKDCLPKEFWRDIFKHRKYYLLLYNLKCLEILQKNFGVKLK